MNARWYVMCHSLKCCGNGFHGQRDLVGLEASEMGVSGARRNSSSEAAHPVRVWASKQGSVPSYHALMDVGHVCVVLPKRDLLLQQRWVSARGISPAIISALVSAVEVAGRGDCAAREDNVVLERLQNAKAFADNE